MKNEKQKEEVVDDEMRKGKSEGKKIGMKENTNYNDVFSSVWLERMRKKKWRKKLITRNNALLIKLTS